MKKKYRVKENSEFQKILRTGKSFANRELVIYYKEKRPQHHFRFGVSVGKKIGNAVTRNKIKRHIREAFKEMQHDIKSDIDMIIIARKPTVQMNTSQIKKSLSHLLRKQCLFKEKNDLLLLGGK